MAGKATHIAGVVARGNTLTIRLTAPAPDLVARLAMPFFCAVPIGTPIDPKAFAASPPRGRTTSPPTRPAREWCSSATRTTTATVRIASSGSS